MKKKLLKQLIKKHYIAQIKMVLFSVNRKPKKIEQLKNDFLDLLAHTPEPPEKRQRLDYKHNPGLLVGERRNISGENEEWYQGYVTKN